MNFIFVIFAYLSLLAIVSTNVWNNSQYLLGIESLVRSKSDSRKDLMQKIQMGAYLSLGARQSSRSEEDGKQIENSFDDSLEGHEVFKESFKNLLPPETMRIDLCATLMIDNKFFKQVLKRLMIFLYKDEPIYEAVSKYREDCISDLLEELSVSLRKIIGWEVSDRAYYDIIIPDSLWLTSVKLPSKDLDDLYQMMLRAKPDDEGITRSLLYYVCLCRWKLSSFRVVRISVSFINEYMLRAVFGDEVGRVISSLKKQELRSFSSGIAESSSLPGLDLAISPRKMKKIVIDTCSSHGISFDQFQNALDFSRYSPPKNEWMIESHLFPRGGVKIMKKPFLK